MENTPLTRQQKAEEVLIKLAKMCADGEWIHFDTDWNELGAATLTMEKGHTHIGCACKDYDAAITAFIDGLYGQLVQGVGLTWEPLRSLEEVRESIANISDN